MQAQKLDESLLAQVPPFRRLNRAQIRQILDLATPQRHNPGVAVFENGAVAERFFLLLDGHVRVLRLTEHGEQVVPLHIASGQLIGIAAALGRATYPATAETLDDCITLSWPNRLWPQFVADYDGFATETYKTVGLRLEEVHDRLVELSTQQVEQRVANALLRLITQSGKKVVSGVEIDFPISRLDISEMTGTTLHTVSRLLSAWEKDGIVASSCRKVTATDPHRLMLLSRPTP
jgi:CRP/FNR family transcriptional regulator, nitrogen oxide reductase regulator